jgi:molecular chaperone DnaK
MLRDAADHADEDREIEHRITLRNRADSAVAYAERSLREYGSTLPDEVRRKIEEAIEEARQAAEEGNSETVDAILAELSKLHQQLYLSQTAQQALPQHAAKPQEQAQTTYPNFVKVRS